MATGDLKNNIRKLQACLKRIRYPLEVDLAGLSAGNAVTFLPIFHYAFTTYSHSISSLIVNSGVELYGKSDNKFMMEIYRVLRDVFDYKPPITRDQFFSSSYCERKVMMACEVLDLIHKKHVALNPPKSVHYRGATGGVDTRHLGGSKGLLWHPKSKVTAKQETITLCPPRKIAPAHVPRPKAAFVHELDVSAVDELDGGDDVERNVNFTPSIRRVDQSAVEVVCIPKPSVHHETDEPINIIAMSPAVSRQLPSSELTVEAADVHSELHTIQDDVKTNSQTLAELTHRVQTIENLQNTAGASVPDAEALMNSLHTIQQSLETLTARLCLMDHRVLLMEAKLATVTSSNIVGSQASRGNHAAEHSIDSSPEIALETPGRANGLMNRVHSEKGIDTKAPSLDVTPHNHIPVANHGSTDGHQGLTSQLSNIPPVQRVRTSSEPLDCLFSPVTPNLSRSSFGRDIPSCEPLITGRTSTPDPDDSPRMSATTNASPHQTIHSVQTTTTGDHASFGISNSLTKSTAERIENMFRETQELCKRTRSLSNDG